MNIQHFEKGFHYNSAELLHIAKKVGKLATYCRRVKEEDSFIRIEAERRDTEKKRDQMKVMITIVLPKKTLRAESRRPDVTEAIDRCVDKLAPQVEKYKAQLLGGTKRGRKKRRTER